MNGSTHFFAQMKGRIIPTERYCKRWLLKVRLHAVMECLPKRPRNRYEAHENCNASRELSSGVNSSPYVNGGRKAWEILVLAVRPRWNENNDDDQGNNIQD